MSVRRVIVAATLLLIAMLFAPTNKREKITDAFDESVCYLTNHFIYLVARDSRMVRLALSQIVSEPEFIVRIILV